MEKTVKQQILATKMFTPEVLEQKIQELIDAKRALNEQGACNLLKDEIKEQPVESGVDAMGYFLSSYTNEKKKTKRIYIVQDDGIVRSILLHPKTKADKLHAPCPVKVTVCDKIRNIFTGYEYLVSTEKSEIKNNPMKANFVDCVAPLSTIQRPGIVVTRGKIAQVWSERDWSKRTSKDQPVSELPELPILQKTDKGERVHLSLVLADKEKSVRISVMAPDRLKMLLGQDDLSFLYKANGKELVVGALRNQDVIVFGRYNDENSEGRKCNPFINIWPLGWGIPQTETPVREQTAPVAEDDSDEQEI